MLGVWVCTVHNHIGTSRDVLGVFAIGSASQLTGLWINDHNVITVYQS